jgi:hypothetical protein
MPEIQAMCLLRAQAVEKNRLTAGKIDHSDQQS